MTIAAPILKAFPKLMTPSATSSATATGPCSSSPALALARPSAWFFEREPPSPREKLPRELVVCTFTEKAAFELRDRISAAARKIGYKEDLSELRVSTIHGLCNRLLIEYRHHTPLGAIMRPLTS